MKLKITKIGNRHAIPLTTKIMMENGWKLGDEVEVTSVINKIDSPEPSKPLSTIVTPDRTKVRYKVEYKMKGGDISKEAILNIDRDPETPAIISISKVMDRITSGKAEVLHFEKVV